MGAVWQILTQGSPAQRAAAVEILVETRRRLYGVLADGTEQERRDRRRLMTGQQTGLRISDADREQAAADLSNHYAEGRLTHDEHAERLDAVWTARTHADLAPIFEDLPSPATTTAGSNGGAWPRGHRRWHGMPVSSGAGGADRAQRDDPPAVLDPDLLRRLRVLQPPRADAPGVLT